MMREYRPVRDSTAMLDVMAAEEATVLSVDVAIAPPRQSMGASHRVNSKLADLTDR
jgi:hypothetical protein